VGAAEWEGLLGGVGLFRYCAPRDVARIAALAAPLAVAADTVVVSAGAREAPLVVVLAGVARGEGRDGS
jgi:hypothetical protein